MPGAVAAFCIAQDRIVKAGEQAYVDRQRAALAANAMPVTVDDVMQPWIRRSVRTGLLWGSLPIVGGAILLVTWCRHE